ncbi:chemotaxis protein histidine kinase CheA [Afipia massiliensis]|uniref:Chemotaxis protein histidine kinase CheA n=1 Tax=Afipia massiliensis TaxID=211460 RepID=A0A840MXW8_9BRAD|nr:cell envelope biogenesis protein TolA [Afipia massiliensis]MBB5051582.1 chemotaxis protein histidine kinase CheA [Afipia massiliensis]
MRTGAAISVAAHVAALTACLVLAGVRPFDPTTAEAITVDIVTPEEAPPLPKEPDNYDFPKLDEKSQEQKAQESQQQAAPEQTPTPAPAPSPASNPKQESQQAALQQQATEQPKPAEQAKPAEPPQQQSHPQSQPPPAPSQPEVPTAAPDITSKFGMMFTLPDAGAVGDFDAKATAAANIKVEDAAALRAHLKSCSVLPKSVAPSDNVRIVLRVAFQRDGRLAAEPLLIEASASEKGPALMRSAMDALAKCQPYAMLAPDRYDQWRMLDLSFSPKDFKGG